MLAVSTIVVLELVTLGAQVSRCTERILKARSGVQRTATAPPSRTSFARTTGGTAFERVLELTGPGVEALEQFHGQVEAESSEAFRRLKAVLEGLAPGA